jgi:hypothetical protein
MAEPRYNRRGGFSLPVAEAEASANTSAAARTVPYCGSRVDHFFVIILLFYGSVLV